MRVCSLCNTPVPDGKQTCPRSDCFGMGPDIVERKEGGMVEYVCPICGAEVLYVGVVPAALECSTPGCRNFRRVGEAAFGG